jgi:hypothetical protein
VCSLAGAVERACSQQHGRQHGDAHPAAKQEVLPNGGRSTGTCGGHVLTARGSQTIGSWQAVVGESGRQREARGVLVLPGADGGLLPRRSRTAAVPTCHLRVRYR